MLIDGKRTASLDHVEMLIGTAPFEGIDVDSDRRSPVVWSVHEEHDPFPCTGDLRSVSCTPGAAAAYDPEAMVEAIRGDGVASAVADGRGCRPAKSPTEWKAHRPVARAPCVRSCCPSGMGRGARRRGSSVRG